MRKDILYIFFFTYELDTYTFVTMCQK